jgi:hypothetical protein
MRCLFALTLTLGWLGLFAPSLSALAADPVGTAISVHGGVSASGPGGSRSLAGGADIFLGDTVETGLFGQVEIEFGDHTRLAMGPRSTMVIDDYVLRSPGRLNKFALTATRGAFRFLTGDSAKPAYQINTPTATIGIRGTEFDFAVARVRATAMALYGGFTRVCSQSSGACVDLRESCEVALIDDGRAVDTSTAGLTETQIRLAFPFLLDEARLTPALRVGSGRCEGGNGASHQRGERNEHEHHRGDQEAY